MRPYIRKPVKLVWKGVAVARILIIEDDFTIRQSVEFVLRRAGYDVASLESGSGALDMIESYRPDLIVLDLMLPGVSGFEIAEALRKTNTETAIIMISALGEDSDKIAGLSVGADDYLAKPFSTDELLARVQANLRRVRAQDPFDSQTKIEIGDLIIDPQTFTVTIAGDVVTLRTKEFQLLYTLARHCGELSTRQKLAQTVWGYEHMASSRTIDVHIQRLRALLEEKSAYRYIQTIRGKGYRFNPIRKDGALS